MADSNDPEPKKGLPGGFLIFIFAVVLIILTLQSVSTGKNGRVSFSYQLEHLDNLHLIDRDQSKKVAVKDNLVTFSGKFLDQVSQEGKDRFQYLQLLNQNQELQSQITSIQVALDALQKSVVSSARYFFSITGQPVSKGGYTIIGRNYDTDSRINSIVINGPIEKNRVNLAQ